MRWRIYKWFTVSSWNRYAYICGIVKIADNFQSLHLKTEANKINKQFRIGIWNGCNISKSVWNRYLFHSYTVIRNESNRNDWVIVNDSRALWMCVCVCKCKRVLLSVANVCAIWSALVHRKSLTFVYHFLCPRLQWKYKRREKKNRTSNTLVKIFDDEKNVLIIHKIVAIIASKMECM